MLRDSDDRLLIHDIASVTAARQCLTRRRRNVGLSSKVFMLQYATERHPLASVAVKVTKNNFPESAA